MRGDLPSGESAGKGQEASHNIRLRIQRHRRKTRRKRRWLTVALLLWLPLLIASHLYRAAQPGYFPLRDTQQRAWIAERERDETTGRKIALAYEDWRSAGPEAPVVVVIHGSPQLSGQLTPTVELLAETCRVIVPDLPGFGPSSHDVADYSTRSHAHYTLELLDHLEIEQAHFLGFSQGGGVILNVSDLAPERVQSLLMVSAIGVQEIELLGDYHLNHLLYSLQHTVIWTFQELVLPHFGWMDRMDNFPLNRAYARNFSDTDQRPFRDFLERYAGPMLIVHGRMDRLVPFDAAREHARIVPQSETFFFDGGHFMVFMEPQIAAARMLDFIGRAENGQAVSRPRATPDRLAAANESFSSRNRYRLDGTGLVVISILLALCTLLSEDLTCIGAGLLASQGVIPFWAALAACAGGIFLGDIAIFLAGRYLGSAALRRAPVKWFLRESQVTQSAEWIRRRGPLLIFLTRFLPGTRLPFYFAAGMLRMGFWRFFLWFALAAGLWTPLIVGLSTILGKALIDFLAEYQRFAVLGLILVVLLIWAIIRIIIPMFTHEGRRLLYGLWQRRTRWEYWPGWLVYPPVAIYLLWLGLRFRSLTLFTAANPGIGGAGGLVFESKSQILQGLGSQSPFVARWKLLPSTNDSGTNAVVLASFMSAENLGFPVVLKPDIGQRGQGVAVIQNQTEALAYLEACPDDVIAQEYIPGLELGIFYYRRPGEDTGHIFSITEKRLPFVTGDGQSTLRRLITEDDRAVAMAPWFFRQHAGRLLDVPASGQRVQLTQLGTHCRGAVFSDGERFISDRLRSLFDEIARPFDGFFFGRFDARAPDEAAWLGARDVRVIELNGVSSEATNIYDSRYSLFDAYRILFRQWRLAFEIGAANRARGSRPVSALEVFRLMRDYAEFEPFEVPALSPVN